MVANTASFRANSGMQLRESKIMKSLGSPLLGSPKKNRDNYRTPGINELVMEYNDFEDHVNSIIGTADQKMTPKHFDEETKEVTQ